MRMPALSNPAPLAGLALRCQSDSRLVRLSREGQPLAFEEVVRRYREPLVSFAAAIVRPDRAEDVVQEAFGKAHAALVAGNAEVKLKPWLYTIVRNRALNDLRDEPAHEPLDENFDGVPQPPEVAARREELAALMTRVKDLPSTQREALIQRELEGRSHAEIAASLGATPGAVRGLIFRARTALRDAAGILIPTPVLRALLSPDLSGEAAGAGVGAAAAGLTAGGGGGIAIKAGTGLAIAVLAVGSGVALDSRDDGVGSSHLSAAHNGAGSANRGAAGGPVGADLSPASERVADRSGPGESGSSSGDDSGDSEGPHDDSGEGGSGRGESGDDDPGGEDHSGEADGHEGPGGTGSAEHELSDGDGHEGSSSGGSGGDEGSGSSGDDGGETSGDSGGTSGDSGETSGDSGSGEEPPPA
jgi:RNA polymerase sigma factor (sigma-70 family)